MLLWLFKDILIIFQTNKKTQTVFYMLPYLRFALCYLLFIISINSSFSAEIDTLITHSKVMKKDIKAVVITPASYSRGKSFPVVYLLHGWSNNYSSWVKQCTELPRMADHFNVIIVCPDGGYSSWYFDSPIDSSIRYETYITKELISYIDSKYKTIPEREGRSITGLSMGGHGALYLAIRHQDLFAAAGSMSGGVDIRPFPNNWDIASRLGKYQSNPENWEKNTVINLVHQLSGKERPALMIDCGISDFFYPANLELHKKLTYMNIPHDFISRPGNHNWDYWNVAIQYQLLFMNNHMKH